MKESKNTKKRLMRIGIRAAVIIVIIIVVYVAYVLIDYDRIPDYEQVGTRGVILHQEDGIVPVGDELEITTWNIGFGAYTADFGFFTDGGKYSKAKSEDSVTANLNSIVEKLNDMDSDFNLIQEVDMDADRSYHVNECKTIEDGFMYDVSEMYQTDEEGEEFTQSLKVPKRTANFAVNCDSSYLFYPIFKPMGATKSGIMTFSKYNINSAVRRSLPMQTDVTKLLDLDGCYTVSRLSTDNGKELVLYNLHLSDCTTDTEIVKRRIEMLNEDMQAEYENGNYVIAGGDFSMDLLGDSGVIFGVSGEGYSRAESYPFEMTPEGFTLKAPLDEAHPVPSCRNADGPWDSETQFQVTTDGFIVSDNVETKDCAVIDTQFENSDHNPVVMHFELKK